MTEPWDRTFYLCVGHEWCVCPLCSTYQREGIKVLALYWKKLCANIAPNVYQNVEMNKKSFFLAFLRCFVSKRIHLSLSSSFSHLVRCRLNIFPVSLTVVGYWLVLHSLLPTMLRWIYLPAMAVDWIIYIPSTFLDSDTPPVSPRCPSIIS